MQNGDTFPIKSWNLVGQHEPTNNDKSDREVKKVQVLCVRDL